MNVPQGHCFGPSGTLYVVGYTNAPDGFVNFFSVSKDLGVTWTSVSSASSGVFSACAVIQNSVFVTSNLGIQRTENEGKSFSSSYALPADSDAQDITAAGATLVVAGQTYVQGDPRYLLLVSLNAGESWTSLHFEDPDASSFTGVGQCGGKTYALGSFGYYAVADTQSANFSRVFSTHSIEMQGFACVNNTLLIPQWDYPIPVGESVGPNLTWNPNVTLFCFV
jgi:hypothetical protein